MASTIPQTGGLYYARQSQLKAIADKIRAKSGIDSLSGKNLLPSGVTTIKAEAGETYIFSANITWDGQETSPGSISFLNSYGTLIEIQSFDYGSAPASGTQERISLSGTAPSGTVKLYVYVPSALNPTNIMVEKAESGQTEASAYEAYYKRDIVFPDEFVSCIDNLVSTSDADAQAKHIRDGKTAYVNGQKVTGTAIVVKENTYNVQVPTGSNAQTIAAGSMYRLIRYPVGTNSRGIKRISSSGYSASDFDVVYYQSFTQSDVTISVFLYNKSGVSKTVNAKSITLNVEYYTEV